MAEHNYRWMRPDGRVSWTYADSIHALEAGPSMPTGSRLQSSPDNGKTWVDDKVNMGLPAQRHFDTRGRVDLPEGAAVRMANWLQDRLGVGVMPSTVTEMLQECDAPTDPASRLAEGLGISRGRAKDILFPFVYGAGSTPESVNAAVDRMIEQAKKVSTEPYPVKPTEVTIEVAGDVYAAPEPYSLDAIEKAVLDGLTKRGHGFHYTAHDNVRETFEILRRGED